MRRWALLALLAAAPAAADPQEPTLRIANLRLDGAVARVGVRWDLGTVASHDNVFVSLPIPSRAVVTGATAIVDGHEHRLKLLHADEANAAYDAVSEAPPSAVRAAALIMNGDPKAASLDVEIVLPEPAHVEIDGEAELPTCFYRGIRYVELPSTTLAPQVERMRAAHGADIGESCASTGDDVWFALSKPDAEAPRIATVTSRLHLPAKDFARVELDLADQLADIPSDLATVILVDGSRSVTAKEAEVQRAVVLAYLHAAPSSRVQVLAYSRKALALLPGWSNASAASARVDRELRALAFKNGSNVDAGIVAAGEWLARTHGTKRVVLFTDERTASRFDELKPEYLVASLPKNTVVHVVAVEVGDGTIQHDDNVSFAQLAVATEGIGARANIPKAGTVDAELLVRPLELEHIAMVAPGWKQATVGRQGGCVLDPDATLGRGKSCTWWGEGSSVAGPVTISGMLWNKRVTRLVRPDPGVGRELARRLVSESGLEHEIDEEIARAAFALDSFWSLFGTWGGTGGYAGEQLGHIGMSGGGSSSDDFGSMDRGFGHGSGTGIHLDFHSQLQPALDACRAGNARVEIDTETTAEEIVDVTVRTADPIVGVCVTEKVWDTFLSIAHAPSRITTTTVFGG